MTIIHTVLTAHEVQRLRQADKDYLNRKLEANSLLNTLLHRPVNRALLTELRCILDRQPIPRRKTEQYRKHSKVAVFNALGMLVRIEHSNGRVLRYV